MNAKGRYWVLLAFMQAAYACEVVEVSLTASRAWTYQESLPANGVRPVRVTFSGPGGKITVSAFWDGGAAWKARFAPPAPGEWTWTATGVGGAHGTVRASAGCPALRVARNGRHFEWSDGRPFLWIGDTWWNWAKPGIHFDTFRKLADDRSAKGFTVGQLFFAGGHLLDDRRQPKLDEIRRVERMIAYANNRGMVAWIHPWWGGKGTRAEYGEENVRRWWRYTMDRLGAYQVIWVLAAEYNMEDYGGYGLAFWKDLGAMIRREDPYRRLIGAHPTPPGWDGGSAARQWSTGEVLGRERWLDFNQSQLGHGRWRNEMAPVVIGADYARKPRKPTLITEPWYEFVEGNAPAADVRFSAWSSILSGAAGFTYGGGHIWWAHVPEAPMEKTTWPLDRGFENDTLDYPGARSVSFLAKFLGGIEWWRLAPHPELVREYAARFCLAAPGREYVVYLRWGGRALVDLRPSSGRDSFEYRWLNLAKNAEAGRGRVEGGAVREFRAPAETECVLYLRR